MPAPLGPITATSSPRPGGQRHPSQRRAIAVALDEVAGRQRYGRRLHGAQVGRIARREASFRRRRRRRHRTPYARRAAAGDPRRARAGLRGRERRERRRRRGHHAEDGARAARDGSRRDHARQPRLPPPRGLRAARPRDADRAAGQLPEGKPRPRSHGRGARRHAARRGEPVGDALPRRPSGHRSPTRTRRCPSSSGRADAVLVDMHAEATSEKVAMGWHLDGRVDRVRGHAHPRADRRRPRAAGRDRLRDRRGDDRPARRSDRREARARARALPDDDRTSASRPRTRTHG